MIAPHLLASMDEIMSGLVQTLPDSPLYMLSHLLESPCSPLYTLLDEQEGAYLLRNPHGRIIYIGITITQSLANRVWYHANGESEEMKRNLQFLWHDCSRAPKCDAVALFASDRDFRALASSSD
jgi:hypothetical protein